MIYMETQRMVLRDYRHEDQAAYFQLKSDPETMYYLGDIQLFTEEAGKKDFAAVLEDRDSRKRRFYFFHMELKESGEQVGSIGYTVTDETPVGNLVGLGYFSYPKFWGKGYVTEALKRVVEFAFAENNVYRISTGCLAENAGSERVMQKCGFIKEAEHIDYEWHDGKLKTRLEYRLLKPEWEEGISMNAVIVPGTKADVDEIARLYDDLNDTLAAGVNYPGWKKGIYPTIEDAEAGVRENTLYVAKAGGKICGTIILNHQPATGYETAPWQYTGAYTQIIVIHTLAVAPEFAGKGIGKRLIEFTGEHAKEKGIQAIRLDVFEKNLPAIRLYERCGYVLIATADLGLGEYGLDRFRLYEKLI